MTKDDGRTVVRDKNFDQTFTIVASASIMPRVELLMPAFLLSEVDFLKMNKPSGMLFGIGSGIFSYSVSYALPKVIEAYQKNPGKPVSLPSADNLIISATFIIGVILLFASRHFSSDKQKINKKIKEYYKNNPPTQVLRK